MKPVRIGFIGCGAIASTHSNLLAQRNDVEFVGCFDINTEKAESFGARFNVPIFKDALSMYDTGKPQAVYIAVPPVAHGAYELEAATRGIHLFIEMPIALDIKTARTISAAIRKSKILAKVGYCYRYCDLTQQAKRLLSREVNSLITGSWHTHPPEAKWSQRKDQGGGQIMDETSHIIDLLLYLCGPVSEVHAMGTRGCLSKIKDFDVEESSVINLRLKTGAVASISTTCILNHPGSLSMKIDTPQFSLTLSDDRLQIREDYKIIKHFSAKNKYEIENDLFLQALKQNKRTGIRSSYAEGLKTLRVTLAASESIQTGLPVIL
ncbi:MAG: Gfo/Idh/MocA family protein [Candidatus Hydrogenedentales bacterium]|jgi:myo-inositol 2-dehydrogenase/D-chiro-inositol 1-dehydrogenase